MKLVLKNGSIIEIPKLYRSGGWIYRPKEARTAAQIRQDTNKTFGRQGEENAGAWMRQWLQNKFDQAQWSPIALIDPDDNTGPGRIGRNGMAVSFKHPALGWQTLTFHCRRARESDRIDVRVTWEGWNIQEWYPSRKVPDDLRWNSVVRRGTLAEALQQVPVEKAYELAARFGQAPITVANEMFTTARYGVRTQATFPVPESGQIPLTWPDKPTGWENYEQTPEIHLGIDQDHVYWRNRKHAQDVIVKSTQAFRELAAAMEHHGITAKFQFRTDYQQPHGNRGRYLNSVTFEIPETEDKENKLGHTFTITQSGISVECGYVKDEERWEEVQKRHAANWLKEMTEDLETTTYKDYTYTPNV